MPYIKQDRRNALLNAGLPTKDMLPGDLNFCITALIDTWLENNGAGVNYCTINTCIGVLECAKLELYRRIAAPYEDGKIIGNGDVYSASNTRRSR